MAYRISQITAPSIEPVSLTDAKLHAHIDYSVQDDIIGGWIRSARLMAENYQRRCYISRIVELDFDNFPDMPVLLPLPPMIQLISIKYYDTANVETTLYYNGYNPITTTEDGGVEPTTNADFIINTGNNPRIGFSYLKTWPSVVLRPLSAFRVRYAAGYGNEASDVPQNVKDAILLYCTFRNENRAAETEFPKQFFDLLGYERAY